MTGSSVRSPILHNEGRVKVARHRQSAVTGGQETIYLAFREFIEKNCLFCRCRQMPSNSNESMGFGERRLKAGGVDVVAAARKGSDGQVRCRKRGQDGCKKLPVVAVIVLSVGDGCCHTGEIGSSGARTSKFVLLLQWPLLLHRREINR